MNNPMVDFDRKLGLTMKEAAGLVGLGGTRFRKEVLSGRIRVIRAGRRIVVPRRSIEAYLAQAAQRAAAGPADR